MNDRTERTGWDEIPPGIARVPRRRKPRIANTAMGTMRRKGWTKDPALRWQDAER